MYFFQILPRKALIYINPRFFAQSGFVSICHIAGGNITCVVKQNKVDIEFVC